MEVINYRKVALESLNDEQLKERIERMNRYRESLVKEISEVDETLNILVTEQESRV